ncbi:glycosyltransferase [Marinomonas balearica]|uniref:GT2 family glycosyltransferase n=1 Tax=Marinomonas balearica TaxID=491947 RepID=A0A4R6M7Q9_9GAMM|nr:glycosyltransferase [Marinomonas balearica]TDO97196.1 GT2 family glycosyltransferase [Marinomonas balearica]
MKIAAVIVTYNRLEKLKNTVACSLGEALDKIIIVDNASTDGTGEWLSQQADSRLVCLHLEQNIGGSGGFSKGFAKALELNVDWLVCYDDDAFPQNGAIAEFRHFSEKNIDSTLAGVAAAVYGPDGSIMEMNRPSFHPFKSLIQSAKTLCFGRKGFHIPDSYYQKQEPQSIQASSFVGCFVRCSSIRDKLDLPRTELFIYADDILYTLNMAQRGYKHYFVPTIRFTHDCETVSQRKKYTPLWKAYYTYRNGIELYRVTSGWLFPFVMAVKAVSWTKNATLYEEKSKYLALTFEAIKHGLMRDFSQNHQTLLEKYK